MAWNDWYLTLPEGMACLLYGEAEDGTAVPGCPVAASENHVGAVGGHCVIKEVTLSLDTNVYADGDVLADTQEVASALRTTAGSGVIQSVVVLDKDDQGEALDLVFLKSNVSIGTENSAVSVTDANADEILGVVEVAATDWVDLVNSQIATMANLSIVLDGPTGTSIWVAAISRGAGTYTASGITLKIGILQD
jgi:hypothetical protein